MLTKIGIASRSLPGISRLLLRRNVVIDLINDEVGGIPILPLSLSLYLSLSLSPLKLKCSRDLDSIKATQCALTHPHFWLPIQKRAWSNGVTRCRRRDACNDWLTEQIRPPAVQYAWVIIRNGTGMNHIRDVLSHHSLFRQANPAFPSKATNPFSGIGLLGPFFSQPHDFQFRLLLSSIKGESVCR